MVVVPVVGGTVEGGGVVPVVDVVRRPDRWCRSGGRLVVVEGGGGTVRWGWASGVFVGGGTVVLKATAKAVNALFSTSAVPRLATRRAATSW